MDQVYKKLDTLLLNKTFHLVLSYLLLLLLPLILPTPQLLLGILVNFLLIVTATQFETKKIIPATFIPSISSYTYGLLFGSASTFLLYLIPVIGISNILYISVYKTIKRKYLNILIASLLKSLFLFSITYFLVKLEILPSIFLIPMGIIQFFTALTGGLLADTLLFRNIR